VQEKLTSTKYKVRNIDVRVNVIHKLTRKMEHVNNLVLET